MAVGAQGSDILRQFLTEAVALCLIGGTVGIALGRATSWIVSVTLRWADGDVAGGDHRGGGGLGERGGDFRVLPGVEGVAVGPDRGVAVRVIMKGALLGLTLAGAVWLGGCAVGPDYHPPATAAPAAWAGATTNLSTNAATIVESGRADLAAWWEKFHDPQLTALVREALRTNLDLQIAVTRLREARARAGDRGVVVVAGGGASGSYAREGRGGGVKSKDNFAAGLDAAWELDIFGGTRRGVEAADAATQASLESLRDAQVSVAGGGGAGLHPVAHGAGADRNRGAEFAGATADGGLDAAAAGGGFRERAGPGERERAGGDDGIGDPGAANDGAGIDLRAERAAGADAGGFAAGA